MKHKKIMLKLLAIVLSITNLLNVVPVKTYAADKLIDDVQLINDTNDNLKKDDDLKKELIGIVSMVLLFVLYYKCLPLLLNPILRKNMVDDVKKSYEREFEGQIEKNILTKRQEGVGWCWLACLQGLLKEKGIEKSQKEMFKEITGKTPGWFEDTRDEGLSDFENLEEAKKSPYGKFYNSDDIVYLEQVKNYVRKITNEKYEFKVEFFNMTMKTKVDDICQKIKEVYKNNGNHPFVITDSRSAVLHAVNVIEIDKDENVVVECPTVEIRRTEPLRNFVERYRYPVLTNIIRNNGLPGLSIYYLSPTA